jgi:hypothetical protein
MPPGPDVYDEGGTVRRCTGLSVLAVLVVLLHAAPAQALFHLMQIEQAIGGVNGDTNKQAIQLRMRSFSQNFISPTRIRVFDAAGLNPVVVVDFTQNVPLGRSGDRILVVSSGFDAVTEPAASADFIMTNLIPGSYLAAGSMTFEQDDGLILWRLSWGGAAYTGPTSGSDMNDVDGEFGPAYPGPLPSDGTQAVRFQGTATALSTNNAANYSLTTGPAVFTNNDEDAFTVRGAVVPGDLDGDGKVDLADHAVVAACLGGPQQVRPAECDPAMFDAADFDGDSDVDLSDAAELAELFGGGVE